MTFPKHTIHVYQRPKQGTQFIKRYDAYNYQHSIVNNGWFDTASCDIAVQSEAEGQSILNQYLGSFVAVYVDNPVEPIWEGYINRITFNAGNVSDTISLDEMTNRVNFIYTAAANAATQTTAVNNTDSQAIYGIKHGQFEFGPDPSAGTHRTALQATILAQLAFPQASSTQGQGQANIVHLELLGLYHTLEWQNKFTILTAALVQFDTQITNELSVISNGTTFFDSTDLSKITTNTLTTPAQFRGSTLWDRLQKIAEAGDGTNYWVIGITPTSYNTKTRVMYYRQANSTIVYTARRADGLKVRNLYGKYIAPWRVVPDAGIRVTDALVGYNNAIQPNPNETYIQSIQYDANSQQVTWLGADDTTARAAFQLKRGYKPVGRKFGSPFRTLVT